MATSLFSSQYAAYEALSDRMKGYLEGPTAVHDAEHIYRKHTTDPNKRFPATAQPIVRTHPVTKRKCLFADAQYTTHIVGLDKPESDAILKFLFAHCQNPNFQVRFRWQPHSVAFWDNRCVEHHAVWDYFPQTLRHRVTIQGDKPFDPFDLLHGALAAMTHRRDFVTKLPLALFGASMAATFGTGAFAQDARTVTAAFPMDILSWDPVSLNPTRSRPSSSAYDQPLELAPDLKLPPSVVSSYKWLDTTCTPLELNFRDGVSFHNGDKLTSADFKFSFFDRPRAEKASLLAGVWSAIEAIDTPTPLKARGEVQRADGDRAGDVRGHPGLHPAQGLLREGRQGRGFEAKPGRPGPLQAGRVPARPAHRARGLRRLHGAARRRCKRLVFQATKDPTARAAAMQAGQADLTMNIPVREAERLGALPALATRTWTRPPAWCSCRWRTRASSPTENVRLACHHAIDKAGHLRRRCSADTPRPSPCRPAQASRPMCPTSRSPSTPRRPRHCWRPRATTRPTRRS